MFQLNSCYFNKNKDKSEQKRQKEERIFLKAKINSTNLKENKTHNNNKAQMVDLFFTIHSKRHSNKKKTKRERQKQY